MGLGGTNNCCLSFKTLFGTFIVLGFIVVGTLQSEGNKTKTLQHEHVKDLGLGGSNLVHQRLDLNYISKRRVPNGPDPIHNRRAGNSRRPPRHA